MSLNALLEPWEDAQGIMWPVSLALAHSWQWRILTISYYAWFVIDDHAWNLVQIISIQSVFGHMLFMWSVVWQCRIHDGNGSMSLRWWLYCLVVMSSHICKSMSIWNLDILSLIFWIIQSLQSLLVVLHRMHVAMPIHIVCMSHLRVTLDSLSVSLLHLDQLIVQE